MHYKGKGERGKNIQPMYHLCKYVAHGKLHARKDGRVHARTQSRQPQTQCGERRLGRGRSTAGYADFHYSDARVDRRRCSTAFSAGRSGGRQDD